MIAYNRERVLKSIEGRFLSSRIAKSSSAHLFSHFQVVVVIVVILVFHISLPLLHF